MTKTAHRRDGRSRLYFVRVATRRDASRLVELYPTTTCPGHHGITRAEHEELMKQAIEPHSAVRFAPVERSVEWTSTKGPIDELFGLAIIGSADVGRSSPRTSRKTATALLADVLRSRRAPGA